MAYQVNAASGGMTWSGSGPAIDSFTFFSRFMRLGDGGTGDDYVIYFFSAAFANTLTFRIIEATDYPFARVGGVNGATISSAISLDTWYDVAVVCNGLGTGNLTVYCGPTGGALNSATGDTSASTWSIAGLYYGNEGTTAWPNVRLDDFRVWTSALTLAEIEVERARRVPTKTPLEWWVPLLGTTSAAAVIDRSGNGRSLTANGSPTIVDGAPVGWGASIIVPQYAATYTGPTLSLPGVQSITATSAVPKVTLTFA
jgi:hypothetical protein